MRWNLLVRFLGSLRPPTIVISEFVGSEVAFGQPRARLEANDIQSRLGEGERCDAADGSETDDHDIGVLESGGHGLSLYRHREGAGLREHVVVVRGLVIRGDVRTEPLLV